MNDKAFSPDGYIISQQSTQDMSYGRMGSHHNGCGWIAAYNLLRALGRGMAPEAVRDALEPGLWLGGMLGTGPRRLRRWLVAQRVALRATWGRRRALALAAGRPAGIVMYGYRWYLHYVAFVAAGPGRFRFLNARDGEVAHEDSLEHFLKEHATWPVVYLIAVEGKSDETRGDTAP